MLAKKIIFEDLLTTVYSQYSMALWYKYEYFALIQIRTNPRKEIIIDNFIYRESYII